MNSNIKITIIINNTLTKRLYEMCSIVLLNVGRKKHCVLHNVTFTMLYKKNGPFVISTLFIAFINNICKTFYEMCKNVL